MYFRGTYFGERSLDLKETRSSSVKMSKATLCELATANPKTEQEQHFHQNTRLEQQSVHDESSVRQNLLSAETLIVNF